MPTTPLTHPEVFIIESLPPNDPHDGEVLYQALKLSGKNPIYKTVKNSDEFENALCDFKNSKYRFLHISLHGNRNLVAFESGFVDYSGFAALFRSVRLHVTRIFFSACFLGNDELAKEIISANQAIHSVVAPCSKIPFDFALAIWEAFYVKAFNWNRDSMSEETILLIFRQLTNFFSYDFEVSSLHCDQMKIHHFNIKSELKILREAKKAHIVSI